MKCGMFVRAMGLMVALATTGITGVDAAEEGEGLYLQKCGRCHVAYDPSDFATEEWGGIVRSMKAQAGLSAQDIEALSDYLEKASQGSRKRSGGSGPSVGGYLYTEYFRTPDQAKNFDLHYLAVAVSGWASDEVSYLGEFELEHGGKGDNTFVEQAYIDWWVRPNVAVKVGAMLTPFNRFDEFHDPIMNQVITRPQMSREIGVSAWKDVGVDLHGYVGLGEQTSLSFDVYTTNGLGAGANLRGSRQYRDNNEELAFGSRLSVLYGDVLEVGASGYRGAWDDAGNHDLTLFGSHLLLRTSLAELYGEWARATSENPAPAKDGDMSGYFIQASRLFGQKYRGTIRFGALDYLDQSDVLGRSSGKGDKDVTELVLGASYYATRKLVVKAEYALYGEGRGAEKDNDQLGLQVAVKF